MRFKQADLGNLNEASPPKNNHGQWQEKQMQNDNRDIYQDHTVAEHKRPSNSEPVLSPGPADPGDEAPGKAHRSPGFSEVPGAGPNPSQSER